MATNPTNNPDRMTAQELRDAFRELKEEIDGLRADFATFRDGISTAANNTIQTQPGETYRDFDASEILLSYDDKGQPTYKVKGVPFTKFGVRVWPETLPALKIDPAKLKPGPNAYKARVRALMGEQGPRKIIGLA